MSGGSFHVFKFIQNHFTLHFDFTSTDPILQKKLIHTLLPVDDADLIAYQM